VVEDHTAIAQGQTVLRQSESETVIPYPVSAAAADLSLASLPGDEVQPKVPASVSSVAIASLAMSTVSPVTDSLTSSLAPVAGVLSSMLSVRESRAAAELERTHTSLGALSYAASFVQKEQTSCGEAMRTDVELTVRGDDARSDSSDETLELSPQATVRGSVAGHTGPQPWRLPRTMICHSQRLALRCLLPHVGSISSASVRCLYVQRFRQLACRLSRMIGLFRRIVCDAMRR